MYPPPAILALVVALAGCTDDRITPLAPSSQSALITATATPSDPERNALDALTRAIAIALQDEGLRQRIKNDMRSAPYQEHKLEFSSYIRGASGGILLAKMVQATGKGREEVLGMINAVRPLEFYMPVAEHRSRWTGGPDLWVASQLEEDDLPRAYDLHGEAMMVGLANPPAVPTLSLVPVETDFTQPLNLSDWVNEQDLDGHAIGTYRRMARRSESGAGHLGSMALLSCDETNPCDEDEGGGGGGGGAPPNYPPGIYFDAMRLHDVHEPWPRGEPEIDVYVSGILQGVYRDVAPQGAKFFQLAYFPGETRTLDMDCAGGQETGYRKFDFDRTGTHYQNVLIAQAENFAITEEIDAANEPFVLMRRIVPLKPPFTIAIWERDDGKQCPAGRRTYELAFTIEFHWVGGVVALPDIKKFDWKDIGWLFGNNNDKIAMWSINDFATLEGYASTWLPRSIDAELRMINRGFSRTNIPPYREDRYY